MFQTIERPQLNLWKGSWQNRSEAVETEDYLDVDISTDNWKNSHKTKTRYHDRGKGVRFKSHSLTPSTLSTATSQNSSNLGLEEDP